MTSYCSWSGFDWPLTLLRASFIMVRNIPNRLMLTRATKRKKNIGPKIWREIIRNFRFVVKANQVLNQVFVYLLRVLQRVEIEISKSKADESLHCSSKRAVVLQLRPEYDVSQLKTRRTYILCACIGPCCVFRPVQKQRNRRRRRYRRIWGLSPRIWWFEPRRSLFD